jgi:hypothetical protein
LKLVVPTREALSRRRGKPDREIPCEKPSARDILNAIRDRTPIPDRRSGSDRRKITRGGRRKTDKTP